MFKPEPCLRPGCEAPSRTRGLCKTCYQIARDLIRHDKTTWEELEKNKRILPSKLSAAKQTRDWFMEDEDEDA